MCVDGILDLPDPVYVEVSGTVQLVVRNGLVSVFATFHPL
jgi:hypothetical protein